MRNNKLKTIAVLGVITICSSLGASTIDANAGGFLSKSTSTSTTTSSSSGGFLSRLSKGIPQVELALPKLGLGKGVRNAWKSFKGLFTSSSSKTDKSSKKGPVNPTGEPFEVVYASLTINGKPSTGNVNGGFEGDQTIYTVVKGSGNGNGSGQPVLLNDDGQPIRIVSGADGIERVILND